MRCSDPLRITSGALGLSNDWAYNVSKQVGNFGEMWDRNITPMDVPRGINNLWTNGGLQYAPPIRCGRSRDLGVSAIESLTDRVRRP